MKKALAYLLALVLVLSLAPMAMAEEPVELTFLTNVNVDTEGYDAGDNPYVEYIEKCNNVKLNVISEATNYSQKVATILASGDLPDYILTTNRDELMMWAQDGLLLPLDEYIDNTEYLKTSVSEAAWSLCTLDGATYAVPMERYDSTPYLSFVERSFVENLGVNMDEVKTLDDWYNLLYQFTHGDPDKNGVDDTIGMSLTLGGNTKMTDAYQLFSFLDCFDAAKAKYIDGELLPFYLTEEYKEFLKWMNKLYADGILDVEYITNTSQQFWEKATSGKVGFWTAFWSIQNYTGLGGVRENLIAVKPALRADGTQAGNRYIAPNRHYIVVTNDCENPQAVIDIMDWAHSEEGGVFVHAGLEGWDYDMVDGEVVVRDDRRGKNWAWRFITLGVQKTNIDESLTPIMAQTWGEDGLEALDMSAELGFYDDVVMTAPYFVDLADFDVEAVAIAFRDNAIMGKVDIDAEWDAYVKNWRKAGGDLWIELYTEYYEENFME